jgi:hypothetical protein
VLEVRQYRDKAEVGKDGAIVPLAPYAEVPGHECNGSYAQQSNDDHPHHHHGHIPSNRPGLERFSIV